MEEMNMQNDKCEENLKEWQETTSPPKPRKD